MVARTHCEGITGPLMRHQHEVFCIQEKKRSTVLPVDSYIRKTVNTENVCDLYKWSFSLAVLMGQSSKFLMVQFLFEPANIFKTKGTRYELAGFE